jgi:hypothetical protein
MVSAVVLSGVVLLADRCRWVPSHSLPSKVLVELIPAQRLLPSGGTGP